MTPTSVKFHKGAGSLELVYSDGNSFTLSGEFLRVHSPSAEVRRHGPVSYPHLTLPTNRVVYIAM